MPTATRGESPDAQVGHGTSLRRGRIAAHHHGCAGGDEHVPRGRGTLVVHVVLLGLGQQVVLEQGAEVAGATRRLGAAAQAAQVVQVDEQLREERRVGRAVGGRDVLHFHAGRQQPAGVVLERVAALLRPAKQLLDEPFLQPFIYIPSRPNQRGYRFVEHTNNIRGRNDVQQ